jgi:hypothetical protein
VILPTKTLILTLALALAVFTLAPARRAVAAEAPPSVDAGTAKPPPSLPEAAPRFALAAFTEGALGLEGDGFYNQLTGARLDFRTGRHLTLGFGASYANLKGKEGRTHNALFAAMLEWYAPVSARVGVPIRLVSGYLPHNGPWLKAALGLSYDFSDRTRLTFEALAPALWVVHDDTVGSLDASIELAFAL